MSYIFLRSTKRLHIIVPDASYASKIAAYMLKNKEHFRASSRQNDTQYQAEYWQNLDSQWQDHVLTALTNELLTQPVIG